MAAAYITAPYGLGCCCACGATCAMRGSCLDAQEVERGDDDIVEVDMHNSCVLVNEMKLKVDLTKYAERHQFNFDEALDEYVSNDQVCQGPTSAC